ncbi:SKP1-like protein 14 [Argentina anserina]|uniref:SKP1-like protein 14 n=1 Tax=Argentina anserina TaxID=57926 RepID=UPI0021765247|nr:SKP1-like protein 14 [Potentilla anserina]
MSTPAGNQENIPTTVAEDSQNKIVVRTADGKVFELKKEVAMEISTIKAFIEEDNISYETAMPLHNVESWELEKVIEYCSNYVDLKGKDKELKAFQSEYIKDMSPKSLLDLTNTANYLEIKYFLDFLCKTVSDQIKNKDVDFVRKLFQLENDFSGEEYEKVKAEHPWAHENLDDDFH